jgi:hypothetical protein
LVATFGFGVINCLIGPPYQAFKVFFESLTRAFQLGQTNAEASGRRTYPIKASDKPIRYHQYLLMIGMWKNN